MTRLPPKISTIKKLLAFSGGVCAYPDCNTSLVQEGVFNATLVHICAASPGGPRFDAAMTEEDRRDFDNLVYMCLNHGGIIDKLKLHEIYTVERLREIKAEHERRNMNSRYVLTDDIMDDVVEEALILATQNNTINGDYGSQVNQQIIIAAEQVSEFASVVRKQPDQFQSPIAQEHDSDDDQRPPEDLGGPTGSGGAAASTLRRAEEETPGILDSIAAAEEITPQWTQTTSDIGAEIVRVGQYIDEYSKILIAQNKRNARVSARIPIFKQLAKRLTDPADRIEDLSVQFIVQIQEINPGIRAMIELVTNTALDDPNRKDEAYTLYDSIEELVSSSSEGFSSLEGMLESTKSIENMSLDLRKPLLKMRKSLQSMLKTREAIGEWHILVVDSKTKISSRL